MFKTHFTYDYNKRAKRLNDILEIGDADLQKGINLKRRKKSSFSAAELRAELLEVFIAEEQAVLTHRNTPSNSSRLLELANAALRSCKSPLDEPAFSL